MTAQPSAWELAADDVLAVLLTEPEAWLLAMEAGVKPAHMPTTAHKAAFQAVMDTRAAGDALHDTAILSRSGTAFDLTWLHQRMVLYDDTRTGDVFMTNLGLVKKAGKAAGVDRLLETAQEQLRSGQKDADTLAAHLVSILTALDTDSAIRGVTASEQADVIRALLDNPPPPRKLTGLAWLDDLTGGFEPGHMWWIGGAYKGRKSTMMLNLALNAVMDSANVTILSREMPRKWVAAAFVAMLAVGYIHRGGKYYALTSTGVPLSLISANILRQVGREYRRWHSDKAAAVDWAIDQYRKFGNRLRTYDSSSDGGGLSDVDSIQRLIKRDKHLYGLDIVFVDYFQLFGAAQEGKGYFDKMSAVATGLQMIAQRERVTLVVVAQKNEESIKSGAGSYSPGIKGGGDAAQTADYLLTTHYKQEDGQTDEELLVRMMLSRWGRGGKGVEETFQIHPASGLLLDSKWVGGK